MSQVSIIQRRAGSARLWACAFLASALAVLAGPAGAHAEAPHTPKILRTNPESTESSHALSTTPLVIGEAEPEGGANTTVLGPLVGRSGLVASHPTSHPDFEIVIYEVAGCSGSVVGRGSAEAFESAGVAVTVSSNAMTALSAEQVDSANTANRSGCSGSLFYWEGNVSAEGPAGGGTSEGGGQGAQGSGSGSGSSGSPGVDPAVTTGRPAAPKLHMSPSGFANDNAPLVVGTAPGAGSVSIFANASCSGSPVAKGSAVQLGAGIALQVADNTTTTFSANAMGGQRSSCSTPVTYVEDSTAPKTRVTMGPGVKTRKRKAVFRFADVTEDPPGTSFVCKVNQAKWKPCSSPLALKRLKPRRYVVRVRATDLAGNVEKTGAKRIFAVVRGS